MSASNVKSRERVRISEDDAKLISWVVGLGSGVGYGLGLKEVPKAITGYGSYNNAKHMAAVTGTMMKEIGQEKLLGVKPATALDRISEVENLINQNEALLYHNNVSPAGLMNLSDAVRQGVSTFTEGWPNNATTWYSYLYGGTNGPDFEMAGHFVGTDEKTAFYNGEDFNNLRTEIKAIRDQHADYAVGIAVEGVMMGIVGGILLATMTGVLVYNKLLKRFT